jgi:DNA-directed RNA polymerase specialized sigma24 family protein
LILKRLNCRLQPGACAVAAGFELNVSLFSLFMAKQWTLTEESFETLLGWLAPERDAAGQAYEVIRQRLVKIFQARGCYQDAEALADETITRVASKVHEIADDYHSETRANYFYGVANNVFFEWRRKTPQTVELTPQHAVYVPPFALNSSPEDAPHHYCLKKCLTRLDDDEQKLVFEYYKGGDNFLNRQKIAAEQNITMVNLRVRAHRLRERLEKCVRTCLKK